MITSPGIEAPHNALMSTVTVYVELLDEGLFASPGFGGVPQDTMKTHEVHEAHYLVFVFFVTFVTFAILPPWRVNVALLLFVGLVMVMFAR